MSSSHKWEVIASDGSLARASKVISATALRDRLNIWTDTIGGADVDFLDDDYRTPNGKLLEVRRASKERKVVVLLSRAFSRGEKIKFESSRMLKEALNVKS